MNQTIRPLMCALAALPLLANAQLFDKTIADDAPTATPNTPVANATAAVSTSSQAEIGALERYIDQTQTLTGYFVQIVYSNRGEQRSEGQFWLKRPGKFFWDYQTPYAQKIVSDGKKVSHYDVDLAQVSITNRNELSGDVAMHLLVGDKKLAQSFKVKTASRSDAPALIQFSDEGLQFFQLEPLGGDENIDQVWVVMHNGQLLVVYIDTGVGQQSLISLQNVSRNTAIADSQFQFSPPAGVDVIGG